MPEVAEHSAATSGNFLFLEVAELPEVCRRFLPEITGNGSARARTTDLVLRSFWKDHGDFGRRLFLGRTMGNEIEAGINSKTAAKFLGLTFGSLTVMRSRGDGPPVHYSGTKPVYYVSELRQWQAECAEKLRRKRDSKV